MKKWTMGQLRKRSVFSLLLMVALLAALWATGTVGANAPAAPAAPQSAATVLNYQGVVQVDGGPFDGTGYFKFAIVNAATGNGTTNYWANDGRVSGEPIAAIPLPVSEGLFNILLGDTTLVGMTEPVEAAAFGSDVTYLRVWFSPSGVPSTYEALEPNQRIASVAYALQAEYAENGPPGPTGATGPTGPTGSTGPMNPNADTVDGYHASGTATANTLIALDASAYLRVPRLLDSNDTAYYLDPASTSVVRNLIVSNSSSSYGGVHVNGTGANGVFVENVGTHGVSIENTGSGWDGVWITAASDDGVAVNSAGDNGLYVGGAGTNGVNVNSAGTNGIYVASAADDGIEIGSANYGMYIPGVNITGVIANAGSLGGYFYQTAYGISSYISYRSGTTNYGILSNGTKSFFQQHPTDASKSIIYASLEGGEAGTYYRGTAQLLDGEARVELPEHFSLVTEKEGLTVQVTPREDCNGLYVAEVTTTYVVVRELQGGKSDARFDFFINGVRAGYSEFQVEVDNAQLGLDAIHAAEPQSPQAGELEPPEGYTPDGRLEGDASP